VSESPRDEREILTRALRRLNDETELLAARIDHTLLRPEASQSDLKRLCDEALLYGFASVCVQPCWVPLCARRLSGSPVRVCSVIGFPHGASPTPIKAAEARWAVAEGASELDMVIALWALKSGQPHLVRDDIAAVVGAGAGAVVKVILEAALLSPAEKQIACTLVSEAGAHFVKTSTGYVGGATLEDVRLLRRLVGGRLGVKASGGIRDRATALAMIEAGADRIGTSSGVAILQ
jgi:deoxyribose-phosphate aldolase